MLFRWGLPLALAGWLPVASAAAQVKNVAIIGAGAAGASAAFHLQKYADEEGFAVNITIFEKTERVGGRTLTVDILDDASLPIELGASIFVKLNQIMYNATEEFRLALREPSSPEKGDLTGIWDGKRFVYQSAEGASWWWDAAKMFWKYGLAPYKAVKLVQKTVGTFMNLYEAPHFPFRSLTQSAVDLDLIKVTGDTGEQFLAANGIDGRFSREILQAATRVNYASNLGYIHGLETMVSFATDDAFAVMGGNWRIFDHMVKRSKAIVLHNTTVSTIGLQKPEGDSPAKYTIAIKDANADASVAEDTGVSFDKVIIANPWQFSGIEAGEGVLSETIDEIPYMKLHVTLFTSPHKIDPVFFGLEPGSKAPSNVYTTLSEDDEPKAGPDGVGATGFYSISTLSVIVDGKTGGKQYAYKIFSPSPVTPDFLSKLFGAEIPDSFVSADEASSKPITWYYPHWFYSYPIELPRVTFQDPIVGDGVYYTSGIESFISTMETSALSGKNVARLIADELGPGQGEKDWVVVDKEVPADARAQPEEL